MKLSHSKIDNSSKRNISLVGIPLLLITFLTVVPVFEITKGGGGVGVENVKPRISKVDIENEDGDYNLTFGVLDFNGWEAINKTTVELYRGDELLRKYVFIQHDELDREFRTEKGPELIDHNFKKDLTPENSSRDDCEVELTFKFPGGNFDRLNIKVEDHTNNNVESSIDLKSIDSGKDMSLMVVPVALAITAISLYKTRQEVETRIYEK